MKPRLFDAMYLRYLSRMLYRIVISAAWEGVVGGAGDEFLGINCFRVCRVAAYLLPLPASPCTRLSERSKNQLIIIQLPVASLLAC